MKAADLVAFFTVMDLDAQKLAPIFEFWRDIESLTPFELTESFFFEGIVGDPNAPARSVFKWDKSHEAGKRGFQLAMDTRPSNTDDAEYINFFTVCLGVVRTKAYIETVISALRKIYKDAPKSFQDFTFDQQSNDGVICLATFKVNHFGKIVVNSFVPSYALCFLEAFNKQGQSFDANYLELGKQDLEDEFRALVNQSFPGENEVAGAQERIFLDVAIKKVPRGVLPRGVKRLKDLVDRGRVTAEFIEILSDLMVQKSGIPGEPMVWAISQNVKRPSSVFLDFMNSAYVPSLSAAAKRLKESRSTEFLSNAQKLFFSKAIGNDLREDVLKDPKAFYELASPKFFNLGRWPQKINEFLGSTQQLAVSRICWADNYTNPIITVNGPPGTGKTMILKEVVSDVIVMRAKEIAKINDVRNSEIFELKTGASGGLVPVLRPEFTDDYAIVVASNNNGAVENITKELPFNYSYEAKQVDYFSEVANRLNSKKDGAWGFLSIALGKASNWNQLSDRIFEFPKGKRKPFLQVYLTEQLKSLGGLNEVCKLWEEEKSNFLQLFSEVCEKIKSKVPEYERDLKQARDYRPKLNKEKDKHSRLSIFSEEPSKEKAPFFTFLDANDLDKHLDSLYTDKELDTVRTELFISALMLHKYLILIHLDKFVRGFMGSAEAMYKNFQSPDRMRFLGTFCFVCPVISTTFASAEFRYSGHMKESIPWLFIDEASQVAAQCAMTLMNKSKRVIVVGDPQQLEPVVGLPRVVAELLLQRKKDLIPWSPFENSLQELADGTQDYGTWIGEPGKGVWTGMPLRAQRRSYPPMFNISNAISYNGQMVLPKNMRDPEVLKKFFPSFWLDVVPPTPSQSNEVPAETEACVDLVLAIERKLIEESLESGEEREKTVLIGTPFRVCATELRREIRQISSGLTRVKISRIGTIHTLQGQQADIIILVLGSKTGELGTAARRWVSNPSNLLNVAVSRGRQSLMVIGNANDWVQIGIAPHEIAEQLERKGLGIIGEIPF